MELFDVGFIAKLGNVTAGLSRLLRTQFVIDPAKPKSPLEAAFVDILILHNTGKLNERNNELMRLELFAKQLSEIESHDHNMLADFRRRLKRAGKTDEYYAIRFEVNITATLIARKIKFIKSESPDFRISDSVVGIECTSTRVRGAINRQDYAYKLEASIRKKLSHDYSNPSTCLAIDITNIANIQNDLDLDHARQMVNGIVPPNGFGSIIIMMLIYNHPIQRVQSSYIRCDMPWISPDLSEVVNAMFPIHKFRVSGFGVPFEA